MWMSVPQIAVLRTRMSTSSGPQPGIGAVVSQMPSRASSFARPVIVPVVRVTVGRSEASVAIR